MSAQSASRARGSSARLASGAASKEADKELVEEVVIEEELPVVKEELDERADGKCCTPTTETDSTDHDLTPAHWRPPFKWQERLNATRERISRYQDKELQNCPWNRKPESAKSKLEKLRQNVEPPQVVLHNDSGNGGDYTGGDSGNYKGDYKGDSGNSGDYTSGNYKGDYKGGDSRGKHSGGGDYASGDYTGDYYSGDSGGYYKSGNYSGDSRGNYKGGDYARGDSGGHYKRGDYKSGYYSGDYSGDSGGHYKGGDYSSSGKQWRKDKRGNYKGDSGGYKRGNYKGDSGNTGGDSGKTHGDSGKTSGDADLNLNTSEQNFIWKLLEHQDDRQTLIERMNEMTDDEGCEKATNEVDVDEVDTATVDTATSSTEPKPKRKQKFRAGRKIQEQRLRKALAELGLVGKGK